MENHVKQLDRFRTQWSTRCCENSDAFYAKTSELLDARENAAAKPPRKKTKGATPDWRKDDPAAIKRREDTKRVLAEIRRRHLEKGVSYTKIIDAMMRSDVWRLRMKHRTAESWRTEAIKRK